MLSRIERSIERATNKRCIFIENERESRVPKAQHAHKHDLALSLTLMNGKTEGKIQEKPSCLGSYSIQATDFAQSRNALQLNNFG